MENETVSDGWFLRRMMRLTPLEKWAMDRPARIQQAHATALELFAHVSLPPQPYCLEIGCGQGVMTRLLVDSFSARLVATDFDPDQVADARRRLHDLRDAVDFRVVDVRDIPFPDAQFDAVFSFGVLHHLMGSWERAISEASRVLVQGGWFVCTDLVPQRWLERPCGPLLRRFHLFRESSLLVSLDENGLRLVHSWSGGASVIGLMRRYSLAAQKQ